MGSKEQHRHLDRNTDLIRQKWQENALIHKNPAFIILPLKFSMQKPQCKTITLFKNVHS